MVVTYPEFKMSTKVHDEDDDIFDQVDAILENARAGLHAKRSLERKSRRNINLSDIPENFAHVPASSRNIDHINTPSSSTAIETPPPRLQQPVAGNRTRYKARQRSLVQATLRWFRDRHRSCISGADRAGNMCRCSVVTSAACVTSKEVSHGHRP